MNQTSECLKGESCNNIDAYEATVCCNASPLLIIHLFLNSNNESPCSTPIFVFYITVTS